MTIQGKTYEQIVRGLRKVDQGHLRQEAQRPSFGAEPNERHQFGGIETIDVIRAKLGKTGFIQYCLGESMKRLLAHPFGDEELQELKFYLARIDHELNTP